MKIKQPNLDLIVPHPTARSTSFARWCK